MTARNLSETEKELFNAIQRIEEKIVSSMERHGKLQDQLIFLQQTVSRMIDREEARLKRELGT